MINRISNSDLIRLALYYAKLDRKSFLGAIAGCGDKELIRATKRKIRAYTKIGKSTARLQPEGEEVFNALLEAQSYVESLLDVHPECGARMRLSLERLFLGFRELRLSRFGKSKSEAVLGNPDLRALSVVELLKKHQES